MRHKNIMIYIRALLTNNNGFKEIDCQLLIDILILADEKLKICKNIVSVIKNNF